MTESARPIRRSLGLIVNADPTVEIRSLIVTLDAWRFSTRSRKAARLYSVLGQTTFIGLAGAGRTGRWDRPGTFVTDGVTVLQVPVRRPATEPTTLNQLRNAIFSYVPAFLRLFASVLSTPAEIVHVTGSPLAVLGLVHRARFRSRLILDIQERPGAVASHGSVTALFRPLERLVLRTLAPFVQLATVVTYGDVATARVLGFKEVVLVRNAPAEQWRAPYVPPPPFEDGQITLAAIGTIFEGRGYELMLRAAASPQAFRKVRLKLYGPGRAQYLDSLRELTDTLGLADQVEWMGPIDSTQVSAAYLHSHVGLALYEATDLGNDGLSNKILECVATGRPVIASDLSENRRFLGESNAGWLTGLNVEALSETFSRAAECGLDDLAEMSRRCRRHGDAWLNWENEFGPVLAFARRSPSRARPLTESRQSAENLETR